MPRTKTSLVTLVSRSTIAIVLVLFAIAGAFTHTRLQHNTLLQQQLRTATADRSRLLRLQIDEESGVRGYAATGNRILLQPYSVAVAAFPTAAQSLVAAMRDLRLDTAAAEHEAAINAEWNNTVARPIINARRQYNTLATHLLGKTLVDRFRKDDDSLFATINAAATNADATSARTVEVVLYSFLAVGLFVTIVFALLSAQERRISAELDTQRRATDLLQSAFIRTALPKVPNVDLHAVYAPAGSDAKVGGDWYDAFELPDGNILFSLGDVAGHGIEAAVVMSRVRQAILSVGAAERDPAVVLSRANDILLLQDATIVTAICGFIDLANDTVTYATAGHPPIVVANGTQAHTLPYWGPPLGAVGGFTYRSFSTHVEPGSTMFLYTDGLLEQHRNLDQGLERLLTAIETVHQSAAADPAAALMHEILAHEPPRDDVAVLTISFKHSEEATRPNSQKGTETQCERNGREKYSAHKMLGPLESSFANSWQAKATRMTRSKIS